MLVDTVEDVPDGVGDDEESEGELEREVLEDSFDKTHCKDF